MRKIDLVKNISEQTGISKIDVLLVIETMTKEIKLNLSKGEELFLRGFGSFIIKKRAAKKGRIIKRNQTIIIPEHYIPAFKPCKEFTQKLKNIKVKK